MLLPPIRVRTSFPNKINVQTLDVAHIHIRKKAFLRVARLKRPELQNHRHPHDVLRKIFLRLLRPILTGRRYVHAEQPNFLIANKQGSPIAHPSDHKRPSIKWTKIIPAKSERPEMIQRDPQQNGEQQSKSEIAQHPPPSQARRIFGLERPHFTFSSSNASCTSCSARAPSSLLMMQLILISLVVMFWILIFAAASALNIRCA